jgi:hypothetical protein
MSRRQTAGGRAGVRFGGTDYDPRTVDGEGPVLFKALDTNLYGYVLGGKTFTG